jgi:DNA-directed RNA polymerase specialized sigma24 family protein
VKQAINTEVFEQVLLSYVEMCYAVALALTHDRDDAHDLTREVLIRAWHQRGRVDVLTNIKSKLLITLRKRFTEEYCRNMRSSRNHLALAERN